MNTTKKDFIVDFFSELNKCDIDYFVFGEYRNLPISTGTSDLDIIVAQKDLKSTRNILLHTLIVTKSNVVSAYQNRNANFYRIIGSDNTWGLQIDLFFKGFYYHTKPYFPVAIIKEDIITYNEIKVLSLERAYFIGFLKEIIHTGKVKDKYVKGFISEISNNMDKYRIILQDLYGISFSQLVFNNLSSKKLLKLTKKLRKKMLRKIFSKSRYPIVKAFSIVFNMKRLLNKTGYTIAFLGADGSGKSTIINMISPILNEAFHDSVYYEHFRPNLLPPIAHLFGHTNDFNEPNVNPHDKKSVGLLSSLIRFVYYLGDFCFGYALKVFPKKAFKSCVWLFDRYYYDYFIDQKRARIKLPMWIIRLGQKLIPEPDIIICLGADPKVIHERKGELSLAEIERQVSNLSDFCKNHKRAVWIDTGGSIDESVDVAMKAICSVMISRFDSIKIN